MSNNKIAFVGDPHVQFNNPVCRQDNYFETILNKLGQIIEDNDYVFLLGDMFSTPVIDIQGLMGLIKLLQEAKRDYVNIYSLIGNHDIYSWNINTLNKTTLGLLNKLELVEILDADHDGGGLIHKSFNLDDETIIHPLSLNFNKDKLQKATTKHSILIGHAFYGSERDKKHSLSYENIKELGYEYIFLGHDHEAYEPKIIEGTVLYRPGSLGRITSHTYNLTKKPFYYQLDTDTHKITQKFLKALPKDMVFTVKVINEKENPQPKYVYDLESLVENFKKKSRKVLSIKKLMEDNEEITPDIIEFISDCYDACELEFI